MTSKAAGRLSQALKPSGRMSGCREIPIRANASHPVAGAQGAGAVLGTQHLPGLLRFSADTLGLLLGEPDFIPHCAATLDSRCWRPLCTHDELTERLSLPGPLRAKNHTHWHRNVQCGHCGTHGAISLGSKGTRMKQSLQFTASIPWPHFKYSGAMVDRVDTGRFPKTLFVGARLRTSAPQG